MHPTGFSSGSEKMREDLIITRSFLITARSLWLFSCILWKRCAWLKKALKITLTSLTESCHRLLALLHLLRHHAADAHQVLGDVTGRLSEALFGHLSARTQSRLKGSHARLTTVCMLAWRVLANLFLREPSAPLRRACFSMLSMDSLLARLAFLQTVWLLSREKKKMKSRGEKKIHLRKSSCLQWES